MLSKEIETLVNNVNKKIKKLTNVAWSFLFSGFKEEDYNGEYSFQRFLNTGGHLWMNNKKKYCYLAPQWGGVYWLEHGPSHVFDALSRQDEGEVLVSSGDEKIWVPQNEIVGYNWYISDNPPLEIMDDSGWRLDYYSLKPKAYINSDTYGCPPRCPEGDDNGKMPLGPKEWWIKTGSRLKKGQLTVERVG